MLTNKVPYPANDGSSIAMASMVDGFVKNGVSVSLLSLNTRKHFKDEKSINKSLPRQIDFHKVDVNTNITPLGAAINLISGQPYHVSRFYQGAFVRELTRILQQKKFDLIQLEGLSMVVYLDLIRRHSKAPVSLRAHNVEYQIWERHIANEADYFQRSYLKLQVNRLRKFELTALKKVDAVVSITAEDDTIINQLTEGVKSISIPCGIALDTTEVCTSSSHNSDMAYLASFDWLPNVQGLEWFLEKVWPILIKRRPDITFKLGGRHMPPRFKNIMENGIEVIPDVPDMKKFVCGSGIVVIPLLAGSGMRIKIIENMALGKCQVSTSIGAEGVQVENGRNILIGDSPEEFAAQVLKALDSEELRKKIETNARMTIETHYSNKDLGQRLLNFYKTQVC